MKDKKLLLERILKVSSVQWDALFTLTNGSTGSTDRAEDIKNALDQLNLIVSIDWSNWSKAQKLVDANNRKLLHQANMLELVALYTALVRSDRFNEGVWEYHVKDGLVEQIGICLKQQFKTV